MPYDRLHCLKVALAEIGPDALILETGCVDSDEDSHRLGSGWSTYLIAQWAKDNYGVFFSVDLKTDIATRGLKKRGLEEYAFLWQGNTLEVIPKLLEKIRFEGKRFDLCYLDSGNEAQLVLDEFKLLEDHCNLFVIDDVEEGERRETPKKKGDLVIPYAREKGYNVEVFRNHAWQAIIRL